MRLICAYSVCTSLLIDTETFMSYRSRRLIRRSNARRPSGSWELSTHLPVEDHLDAMNNLDLYALRWAINTFFKTLKTRCRIEDGRLTDERQRSYRPCHTSCKASAGAIPGAWACVRSARPRESARARSTSLARTPGQPPRRCNIQTLRAQNEPRRSIGRYQSAWKAQHGRVVRPIRRFR